MCEHLPIKDKPYPGFYCVYCGKLVARLGAEDGQIYLESIERGAERRYVAVIHKGQQRPVEHATLEEKGASVRFKDDVDTVTVEATPLVMAFQDSETEKEVLRI
jgi:hypothetical protein